MILALFGFGRAGKIHYNTLMNNSNIRLKYIFDKRILEVCQIVKNDIIITDNLDIILNDKEVNGVIISTPTDSHYELIIKSLNHNKNVFCEKPLSNKRDEIIKCYNLAEKNKLVLLCALNRRFDPNLIKLKNDILSEKKGRVHQIMTISRDFPYPNVNYLKISSGIFHDCAVHDIDFINWLLDDRPISVYVTGNIVKSKEENDGNLDNAVILMEYKNNIIANINLSRISETYDQRVEIYCENGILDSKNKYKDLSNFNEIPISFPERYKESYINELNHFIRVINKIDNLFIKEIDNLNCLSIVEACEKSFKSSTKIFIEYNDNTQEDNFRNFDMAEDSIKNNYKLNRCNQTLNYVNRMHNKYLKFNKKMNIKDIFKCLEKFVDISDPDISLPNYYHGIQTAEAIKKDGHPEWLQLVGLIHDIGKIIYLDGCDKDGTTIKNQWGIVGDTFIVGCKLPEGIVYPEFNELNPDMKHYIYSTKLGIYQKNCGLDNVKCSWGHDEYLYQILRYNNCKLPEEAYYIIRFHSLYSYHKNEEYQYLTNDKDKNMFRWLKIFNKYDLYSKTDIKINDDVESYYDNLINKYFVSKELFI